MKNRTIWFAIPEHPISAVFRTGIGKELNSKIWSFKMFWDMKKYKKVSRSQYGGNPSQNPKSQKPDCPVLKIGVSGFPEQIESE
jgi:hypothetical protein